jgi:hypothetical protein
MKKKSLTHDPKTNILKTTKGTSNNNNNNNNNSSLYYLRAESTAQGQLQTQHSVHVSNYIVEQYNIG